MTFKFHPISVCLLKQLLTVLLCFSSALLKMPTWVLVTTRCLCWSMGKYSQCSNSGRQVVSLAQLRTLMMLLRLQAWTLRGLSFRWRYQKSLFQFFNYTLVIVCSMILIPGSLSFTKLVMMSSTCQIHIPSSLHSMLSHTISTPICNWHAFFLHCMQSIKGKAQQATG